MQLPFTADQFFDVFAKYNSDLPYAYIVLAILAVVGAASAFRSKFRLSLTVLAGLWLWAGIVYHIIYFADVNPAAYLFGGLFILQGLLLLLAAVTHPTAAGQVGNRSDRIAGYSLIVSSLLIYPLLGYFFGHIFPRSPTFGLPCPLTIYTFGIFLAIPARVTLHLAAIPVIWSIIGTTAALLLGVPEDLSLAAAAIVFLFITIRAKS